MRMARSSASIGRRRSQSGSTSREREPGARRGAHRIEHAALGSRRAPIRTSRSAGRCSPTSRRTACRTTSAWSARRSGGRDDRPGGKTRRGSTNGRGGRGSGDVEPRRARDDLRLRPAVEHLGVDNSEREGRFSSVSPPARSTSRSGVEASSCCFSTAEILRSVSDRSVRSRFATASGSPSARRCSTPASPATCTRYEGTVRRIRPIQRRERRGRPAAGEVGGQPARPARADDRRG